MKNRFDNGPFYLVTACYDHYREWSPFRPKPGKASQMLQEALTDLLKGLSLAYKGNFPGWEVDENNPGYLIILKPPRIIRIPFHLLAVFPDDGTQNELWEIAKKIKTTPKSIICISGSNAIRKMLSHVGDIDFCEYIPVNEAAIKDVSQKCCTVSNDVICLRLQMPEFKWSAEDNCELKDIRRSISKIDYSDDSKSHGKIDFVVRTRSLGVTKATNLIIFCDESFSSASIQKSFAHQEALFSSSDWIPQKLNDPLEMGRYIEWLCSQVEKYLTSGNCIKALKRASSLSRVCFLNNYTDAIAELFKKSSVLLEDEKNRISKLRDELSLLENTKTVKDFLNELDIRKKEVQRELNQPQIVDTMNEQEFQKRAVIIAKNLISIIQDAAITGS